MHMHICTCDSRCVKHQVNDILAASEENKDAQKNKEEEEAKMREAEEKKKREEEELARQAPTYKVHFAMRFVGIEFCMEDYACDSRGR